MLIISRRLRLVRSVKCIFQREMCHNKKYSFWNRYKNLNGKDVILAITVYENTVEIVLKYAATSIFRGYLLLSLSLITSLTFIVFKGATVTNCIVICLLVFYQLYSIIYDIKFEKLLIVKGLGFQIEAHYNGGSSTKFIGWQRIKSVFINEVISKQKVIFILALLIHDKSKDTNKIIPLFTNMMPRIQCLEVIYQQLEIFQT